MKELINIEVQTMSSTEIAQLTGKQKKHVHQDIKDQLFIGLYGLKDGQDFDHVEIQGLTVVLDNRGYWKDVLLNREHSLTLITGYDVKSRHAINKRWLELESGQQKPKTALQLAREQVILLEKLDEANRTIDHQSHRLVEKDNLITASNEASIKAGEIKVSEFVKSIDIVDLGERQFYQWMREQGYLFQGSREPRQEYVNRGYFTWKPSEEKYGGKFRYTLRITPRGKVWLAARYMAYLDTKEAA